MVVQVLTPFWRKALGSVWLEVMHVPLRQVSVNHHTYYMHATALQAVRFSGVDVHQKMFGIDSEVGELNFAERLSVGGFTCR